MKISKRFLACAVAASLAAPMSAFATNGYFAHGYSMKSKGMAGTGVALPQDTLANADNPAGMTEVGTRLDVGAVVFSPSPRGYTVTGNPSGAPGTFGLEPGSYDSDNDYFLIPSFGYNYQINPNSSIGVSVYGNGGMNTEYPASLYSLSGGTYGAGTAGVNLEQLFVNGTYAFKVHKNHSLGISLIGVYQKFRAQGLTNFGGVSNDPSSLTDNGDASSTGFGGKIGWLGQLAPNFALGVSYQTKMGMSSFDKYKGLFAEEGDFDIPATATAGLAWDTTKNQTLTFDVQWIQYSDVKAISNPMMPNFATCAGRTTPTDPSCLGGDNGIGFGWEDMTIYKIGYQFTTANKWTWRVGYSNGNNPIPQSEVLFNILAPAVMEHHITGGFTMPTGKTSELTFAAMYAPKSTVKGPNSLEAPGQQEIELNMTQWELGAAWGMKF